MISLNKFAAIRTLMLDSIILQLDQVSKRFSATPVVDAVSLKLRRGELLSLLGASGCGKTTLLRLIAGFERPESGTIELSGQQVAGGKYWQAPEQRDIGMVFQDYALFPHLNVAENVGFGLKKSRRKRSGYPAQQAKEMVSAAIAQVGLSGLEKRYPHELSGGQQQRVALARALAPQPALILLDEPLSNLDVQVRSHLRQEIRTILKTTGTTAIFVTHDQEEALSISDRVAVMNQGKLEQLATPETLYDEPATRFVAEFVTQGNFLPATYSGTGWKTAIGTLMVEDSGEFAHQADVMIRQQDIKLEPAPAGSIVIVDRQFLGREHRYCIQTSSGTRLKVLSAVKPALDIGTRVRVKVNLSGVRLFEPTRDSQLESAAH
ncbi:ABC transporter [Leptolyngbya boryana NIES-2135]|jgi:iron(III) transport system ATP-binding protein|uniref:ABC-type quaternary amine transporter n=2 Tax=Leptolyngbya group TaxID=3081713 RepID=A0A1Z4JH52_LEPBY|nr:ABC transporter [Leptolyngbya boryana NIES-2135]